MLSFLSSPPKQSKLALLGERTERYPGRATWMLFHCVTIFEWLGCTLDRSCDSGSPGDAGCAMNSHSIWPRLTGTLCAQPACHRCSTQCPRTLAGPTEVLQWQEISEMHLKQRGWSRRE